MRYVFMFLEYLQRNRQHLTEEIFKKESDA